MKYTKFILFMLMAVILLPFISFTSDNYEIFDIEIDNNYGYPDTRYNIRGLEIDKENNIYFATINGIDVYNDGVWSVIDNSNTNIYIGEYWMFKSMCIDSSGILYCGGINGLTYGSGSLWQHIDENNPSLNTSKVTDVVCDKNNAVWFTTYSNHIGIIEKDTLKVIDLMDYDLRKPMPPGPNVLGCDPDNNIWYRAYRDIIRFDREKWISYDSSYTMLEDKEFFTLLYAAPNGNIYTVTTKNRIVVFHNKEWISLDYSVFDELKGLDPNLKKLMLYSFYGLEDGRVFLGVTSSMLEKVFIFIMDKDFLENHKYEVMELPPMGGVDPEEPYLYAVSKMLFDLEGNFWVATNVKGVIKYNNYLGVDSINVESAPYLWAFSLYPNPAKDNLNINLFCNPLYKEKVEVSIYNIFGEKIQDVSNHSFTFYNKTNGKGVLSIPLENLNNGTYFINMKAGNKSITEKFIIVK